MKSRDFYRRKLPHWHPLKSSFFLTYRVQGSIPSSAINEIQRKYLLNGRSRKLYFEDMEKQLESGKAGPFWLQNEEVADQVIKSLIFNDKKEYDLWSATVMGNHVHAVLTTLENSQPLEKTLQNHKKFTAREANKILHRSGRFWAEETFDTLIRNEQHFYRAIDYCLLNPFKANLVNDWRHWKWNYIIPILEPYSVQKR